MTEVRRIQIQTPHGTHDVVRDGTRIVIKMTNYGTRPKYAVRDLETRDNAIRGMAQLFDLAGRFNGKGVRVKVAV